MTGPEGGTVFALAVEPRTGAAYAGKDGVWKTTNGKPWAPASAGLTGTVRALAVSPSSPGTIFAGTGDGLFRSTDGAATWERLSSLTPPQSDPAGRFVPYSTGGMTAVAVAPWVTARSPAGTILAGTDGTGLWRSTDSGAHWERSTAGLPATTVDSIAFDPLHPDVVYAAGVESLGSKWMGAVYRSADGGVHWSQTALKGQQELRQVFVDPASPDVVYAGGPGIFESRDGGAKWEKVVAGGVFAFGAYDEGRSHVRFAAALAGFYRKTVGVTGWTKDLPESGLPSTPWAHALAVGANGVVLAATRTGVFASEARAGTWTPASTGLNQMNVEHLGAGPAGSAIVYAGATEGGMYRSLDGGGTWTSLPRQADPEFLSAIAVEQRHPERAWLATTNGLYRTANAGASWTLVPGVPRTLAIAIDPSDESVVYVATDTEVLRSSDGFQTRASLKLSRPPATALAVSPGSPGLLWVGTMNGICRIDPSAAAPDCTAYLGNGWTSAIAIDPESGGDAVYAATAEGIYETRNRGKAWARHPRARYQSLAWAGGALFASSMRDGVEVSCDGGATFARVGVDGPTRVPGVAVIPGGRLQIFASTLEGVYRATLE
ncbi:MAG TPA: hypothetical protein VLU43_12605 [Anaeromyxobacteraceae bacterium]|nr:hypothetical protein [Anaeromyxobacteraceae bacterium]